MRVLKAARQKGQVFIIVAISMVVLIGAIGLAVDSGVGYLIKAKLNAAVDSAAVAGARAAARGRNQAEQKANARQAAENFFAANYPNGYLGSTRTLAEPQIRFDDPNPGSITVDVSATARVPVSFMGVMGFDLLDIEASSQTIRKDLDMAFVMDTSGSMLSVASKVKSASITFLEKFSVTTDRVSLIHFSYGASVDVPLPRQSRGFNRESMKTHINGFDFGGLTNSSEGLWNARDQLKRITPRQRSSLRVIVFFSDGSPNSFASFFNFSNPSECSSAGTLVTGDGIASGTPFGLWRHDRQNQTASGGCNQDGNIVSHLTANGIPEWYNAHGINDQEFRIETNSPRIVTRNTSTRAITWLNVNRASKNLVEAMAAQARSEGIYIFTLGLGTQLTEVSGPQAASNDTGENLLKCVANTSDALPRCKTAGAGQPVGVYCHALTTDDLEPCFSTLAAEILRITK